MSSFFWTTIAEAVRRAQQSALQNGICAGEAQQSDQVHGHILNDSNRELKFKRSHSYVGKFEDGPPGTLGDGKFYHTGSIAYVIYETSDEADPKLGYLLAWSKLPNDPHEKVYVEAGKLHKIDSQTDVQILRKLKASKEEEFCSYIDPDTNAEAGAEIEDCAVGAGFF